MRRLCAAASPLSDSGVGDCWIATAEQKSCLSSRRELEDHTRRSQQTIATGERDAVGGRATSAAGKQRRCRRLRRPPPPAPLECVSNLLRRALCGNYKMPSRWRPCTPNAVVYALYVVVLSSACGASSSSGSGGRPAAPPTPSCSYYTARTVQIDVAPTELLHINVRQNVQGTVKIIEQPRRAPGQSIPGDGRLTVAVNWTSDNAELLDRVRMEVNSIDMPIGKVVNIQLDADKPPESRTSTAVVAGSTAAGVLALVVLISIAVAVARRSSSSATSYKKQQREQASADAAVTATSGAETDFYSDRATYPNSVFSVGEADNYFVAGDSRSTSSSRGRRARNAATAGEPGSADPSTLNLSILYSESATADERRSYRRPPSNLSTDWASTVSVQSSRRSSTKGGHYEIIRPPRQQPQQQFRAAARQGSPASAGGRWESGARPRCINVTTDAAQPQATPTSRRGAVGGGFGSGSAGSSSASRRAQYARRPPVGSYSLTASSVADEEEDDEEDEDDFCSPVIEVPSEFASPGADVGEGRSLFAEWSTAGGDRGGDAVAAAAATSSPRAATLAGSSSSPLLAKSVALIGIVAMLSGTAYSLCTGKPAANVVLVLPAGVRIGSVRLFANRQLQPSFVDTDWYLANKHIARVYDGDDLPVSSNKPCTIKMICPSAANKSLVDCELGTQTCICERGYRMTNRLVCEDIDECQQTTNDACPSGTFCRNAVGSFECLCPPGSFRYGAKCEACSRSCPSGQFEATPCSLTADRVCQPCLTCPPGLYAYKSCSGRQDTECIREGVQLQASANVFAEQLPVEVPPPPVLQQPAAASVADAWSPSIIAGGSGGPLEQTLHVSDNRDKMSFVLKRPSGIQIHVDVSDLELTQQYQPVRYPTDESSFMQQNPSESARQEYRDVQTNYCSQPIPDYYTLMLRVYRKRTTAMDHVVCNATRKNCPPLYRDGETVDFRSFNSKCPKESPDYDTTLPVETIVDVGNSMLCTRRTALLTELFQQAAPSVAREEQPLAFPSVECRQSSFKCEQCIEDNQCSDQSATKNPACCAAQCHAQQYCKEAYSQACSHAPIECATGDLLQYVLTPRYEPNSFQCHLRRVAPQRLMRLAYRVTVPGTRDSSWNSSQKVADVPFLDTYVGMVKSDFFTIFYNTTLNISDEVLLRGSGKSRRSGTFNFSVTSFTAGPAAGSGQIKVSNYRTDMWLANVSSQMPFDVSTTNWQSRHGCDLNVARSLRPATAPDASTATRVQLATKRAPASSGRGTAPGASVSSELLYSLRSQHLPTVSLSIPGNQSLLASLFPRSAIDHSSVHVEATSGVGSTQWEVLVTGRAKQCSSYVGISVSDRSANVQLARYDLLVSCTDDDREKQEPRFWARIRMSAPPPPSDTSGLPASSSASPFGQLLQVTVTDSNTSVSYYVSASSPAYRAAVAASSLDVAVASVPASDDNRTERNLPRSAVIVGVASIFVAVTVASAYGLFAACRWLRLRKGESQAGLAAGSSALRCRGHGATAGFVTAYVLYRLAYAAMFSATALLLLTRHFTADSVQIAGDLGTFRDRTAKDAETEMKRTSDWLAHELRQQQQALDDRVDACRSHVAHKRSELSARIAALGEEARRFRTSYEVARQAALITVHARELARLRAHVANALHNISQQASWLLSAYGQVLDNTHATAWLRFPEVLREQFRAKSDGADDDQSEASDSDTTVQLNLNIGSGFLRSESVSFLNLVGVSRPHTVARTLDTLHKLLDALGRSLMVADRGVSEEKVTTDDDTGIVPPFGSSVFTISKLLVRASRVEQTTDQGSQPLQQPKWQPAAGSLSSTTVYALVVAVDILLFFRRLCSLASDVRRLRGRCPASDSTSCRSQSALVTAAPCTAATEAGRRSSLTAATSAAGSAFGGTTSGRPDSPASASAIMSRSMHSRTTARTANSHPSDPVQPQQQQQPPSRATARSAVTSTTAMTGCRSSAGCAAATMTVGSTPLPLAAPSSVRSSPSTVSPALTTRTCSSAAEAASIALKNARARHAVAWLAIVAALVASAVVLDEHVLTRRLLLRASGLERLEGDLNAAAIAGNVYTRLHARQLTLLAEGRLRDELDPLLHHLLGHDALHAQEASWIMALYEARRCDALRISSVPCQPSRLQPLQQITPGNRYNSSWTLLSASPCQAVPITSRQLTTDSRATLSHAVVFNEFQKYVNALRDVALTAIGTAVLFVNALAVACVVELAVVRYLRARRVLKAPGFDEVIAHRHLGLCTTATHIDDGSGSNSGGDRDDAVDDNGCAAESNGRGHYSDSRAVSASVAAYSSERQDSHSLLSEAASERARSAAAQSSRSAALLTDCWDAIGESAYALNPAAHLGQSSAAVAGGAAADLVPGVSEPEGLMSDSWCHDSMFSAVAPPPVQPPSSSQSRVLAPLGDFVLEANASVAAAATASLLRAKGVQVLQAGETEL